MTNNTEIKLGQVLTRVALIENHTSQGYRPRIKQETWVVCKIGDTRKNVIPVFLCNGVTLKKLNYVRSPSIYMGFKPGEIIRHYFKSPRQALRSMIQRKCPFDKHDEADWVGEWNKEQALIKRHLAKLKGTRND